jgi:antitoxin component HigA of HigAB toxin-antitoxin module
MRTTIDSWLNETPEHQRLFAQEGLILEATEEVWAAMERTGKSKADLARMLNTSKANITQVLNGSRNLTLRTLADIAFALGQTVKLQITDTAEQANEWEDIRPLMRSVHRGMGTIQIAANQDWVTDPNPLRLVASR